MMAEMRCQVDAGALRRFNDRVGASIDPMLTRIERFRFLDQKIRIDSFANITRVLRIIQTAFVFKPELAEDCRKAMEEMQFWLVSAEEIAETAEGISGELLLLTQAMTDLYEEFVEAGPAIETEQTRGAAQLREGVYER